MGIIVPGPWISPSAASPEAPAAINQQAGRVLLHLPIIRGGGEVSSRVQCMRQELALLDNWITVLTHLFLAPFCHWLSSPDPFRGGMTACLPSGPSSCRSGGHRGEEDIESKEGQS